MKPFVGVIGNAKSGKSTVIRSLTGAPSTSFRGYMRNRKTGETILVFASSLQEDHMELYKFRNRIQRAVRNNKCRGIVCAIQPTYPTKRNSLEDILGEATKFTELEPYAFLINPGHGMNAQVYRATAEVTNRLKPFGVELHRLDGNRFPLQNAREIDAVTSLNG